MLLALVPACTRGGIHRWHPNWYSRGQDIRLGERLATQIEDEVTLLRHPALTRLLDGIGQRLLADPPYPEFRNFPYRFKAVDSSEINAFALPGGPIYVNSGLIETAGSEAQLAGVIAHEMTHVAARHATEMLTTVNATNLLLIIALSVIPVAVPPLGLEGARLAQLLGFLQYSRSKESEADGVGAELMWRAGYDPREMANIFRRFEEEHRAEPTVVERLFSSHPITENRIEAIEEQSIRLGPPRAVHAEGPAVVPYGQVQAMFTKD
jgi:predicted Zn-dependent protease